MRVYLPWNATTVSQRAQPGEFSDFNNANQNELKIELKGNLAAMLGAAQNAKRSPETGDLSLQVVMVAGAGFQPADPSSRTYLAATTARGASARRDWNGRLLTTSRTRVWSP